MGIAAVKSHMKSKQHNQIMKHKQSPSTQLITNFFSGASSSVPATGDIDEPGSSISSSIHSEQTSDALVIPPPSRVVLVPDDVLRAEVLWVFKILTSHYSFKSCKDINQLFSKMFPDSQIAQSFSCGATKCAYLTCFGLYPYFHELLIEKIRAVKNYTVSFDESLNPINQKKQMDMMVKFWDQEMNKVTDRYFTSECLGHATAADMFQTWNGFT